MMMPIPNVKRCLAAALTAGTMIAIAVFVALSGPATSQQADGPKPSKPGDWIMYGGTPQRNMVNTAAKGLPVEWNVEEGEVQNLKWSADLGSRSYGGPVIAGDQVYIGTNNQNPRDPKWVKDGEPIDLGVLMAFAEKDGKFRWQTVFTKLPGGRVVDWPLEGLCSTPTIEGERLYFVSNRCEVVCADTAGKIIWKLDMINKLGVFPHNLAVCSPLLIGDHLWVVTANGVDEGHINVPSPKAPSFIKVDKRDGKVLWQNNDPTVKLTETPKEGATQEFIKHLVNRGDLIQHGQWSNPSYAVVKGQPQVIFPGGDGWIRSFDPAGKLIWKFDCNPKDATYELGSRGTRNDFIGTPVIHDSKVYIGVGQDPEHLIGVGHLWCIDMTKKGDVSPDLVTDGSVFPPKTKANPNSAKVWHYGGFTTAEERKKVRRNYHFGRTMSTCAVHDGLCYAAELGGIVHCLDAATGKVHWTHDTKAEIWSSPYLADGKVYLGNDAGSVFVFAHGKEKKILAENTMPGPVRATAVAANGVLYVMTNNKLYALANKQ
jgi:outer membrane protein assembly factor BamB